MAHFYVTAEGARGGCSRTGTRRSGVTAHARGWTIGASVDVRHENGRDVVRVFLTSGSTAGGAERQQIAAVLVNERGELEGWAQLDTAPAEEGIADRVPRLPAPIVGGREK